jgi:outer membrane receptor protein involved in Fe transport
VVQADHSSDPASTYGLNTGVTDPTNFGMPEIRISGFVQHTLGGNQSWPLYTTPNQTLQFTDSATYVLGKHNLKFGGEFRTGSTDNLRNTFGSGEIRFSDLENFTTGDVRASGGSFVFVGDSRRMVAQKSFGLFVQDNWRVTPKLTIDAGLRYDVSMPIHEEHAFRPNVRLRASLSKKKAEVNCQNETIVSESESIDSTIRPWGTDRTMLNGNRVRLAAIPGP